jgi:hypothetical protein
MAKQVSNLDRNLLPPADFHAAILLAPFLGAVLFGVLYEVYAISFERFAMPILVFTGTPRLSYGQESMVTCILMAGLGASAGLIAVAVRFPRACFVLAIPLSAAGLLARFAVSAREDKLARYGPDPSDFIVFHPMFAASALVACLTVLAGVACIRRYWRRTT